MLTESTTTAAATTTAPATGTDEPSIPHPGALFEAAERLGRVHEVGGVVRDRAAAFLARAPALTLFVNVHAQELTDDALLSPAAALSGHARSVVLELTERSSFEHVPNLRARVSLLRRLGYRLAVDDLGAGYAGLTSFAALNPHVVKLDMSLVRGCDTEPVTPPADRPRPAALAASPESSPRSRHDGW